MDPSVDVILSTNSDGRFLAEALDSVVAQSYPHWRVIVVDNGSPHHASLADIVARYPKSSIFRQVPAGESVSTGRNRGIRESTGDLVTFLDDDDVWHPERLEKLVAARCSVTDAVGAYAGGWHLDEDGTMLGRAWSARQSSSEEMLSGAAPFPRLIGLLLDRQVIDVIGGFDETFTVAEDNEFVLRLLVQGELVAVPDLLTGYRRHAASTTRGIGKVSEGAAASERLLQIHLDAAVAANDTRLIRLLTENRRRLHRRQSERDIRVGWALARQGRFGSSARTIGGAIRRSPISPFTAAAKRLRPGSADD